MCKTWRHNVVIGHSWGRMAISTCSSNCAWNYRPIIRHTVLRRLKTLGIMCRHPYYGVRHRRDRRNRANANRNWRRNQWNNVLSTGESKLMVDPGDKRDNVYRRKGEQWCFCSRVDRWGRVSTMAWRGISNRGKTAIVFLDNGVGRAPRY